MLRQKRFLLLREPFFAGGSAALRRCRTWIHAGRLLGVELQAQEEGEVRYAAFGVQVCTVLCQQSAKLGKNRKEGAEKENTSQRNSRKHFFSPRSFFLMNGLWCPAFASINSLFYVICGGVKCFILS